MTEEEREQSGLFPYPTQSEKENSVLREKLEVGDNGSTLGVQLSPSDLDAVHNTSSSDSDISAAAKRKEKEKTYFPPLQDPYDKALKYLEKHNILQLFQVNT